MISGEVKVFVDNIYFVKRAGLNWRSTPFTVNSTMNPRTERLRELMKARELTDAQVADILGLKPTTVRIYRCKTACSKTIPWRALELLELRTATA